MQDPPIREFFGRSVSESESEHTTHQTVDGGWDRFEIHTFVLELPIS